MASFLRGLIVSGGVREAVAEAGTDFENAWALRREYPTFAMYWDRAAWVHRSIMAGMPLFDAVAAQAPSTTVFGSSPPPRQVRL